MRLVAAYEELARQALRKYYMGIPNEAHDFEAEFDYPDDYDWVLLEGGIIMRGYKVDHEDIELIIAGVPSYSSEPKGNLKLVYSSGLSGVDQLRLNMRAYDRRLKRQSKDRQGKNDRVKPLGRF